MSVDEIIPIRLRISYAVKGETYEDEQGFYAQRLAPDRWRLHSSSSFIMDEFRLFWGDEIVTSRLEDDLFQLVEVVQPERVGHYFHLGSSPASLTDGLHALGGEWESEMGGLIVLHVPLDRLEDFAEHFGIRAESGEALHSGVWDMGLD